MRFWLSFAFILFCIGCSDSDKESFGASQLGPNGKLQLNTPFQIEVISSGNTDCLYSDPVKLKLQEISTGEFLVDDIHSLIDKIHPSDSPMSASTCLHLIAARGLNAEYNHPTIITGNDLLAFFTDHKKGLVYFGAPAMIETRFGIRQPIREGEYSGVNRIESHCDQFLAMMGQLGLPLTLPFQVNSEKYTLNDVLTDSVASFGIKQREIAWSAIAYAYYFPPHREWKNKFGDLYNFDDLANELLLRELEGRSCCGTHIVEALVMLIRVDSQRGPILSNDTRDEICDYLKKVISVALTNQRQDGSWEAKWFKNNSTATKKLDSKQTIASRLLPTSHIPHVLMLLPKNLQVSPHVIEKAIEWCGTQLGSAGKEDVDRMFCPYSHCVLLVRHATSGDLDELR